MYQLKTILGVSTLVAAIEKLQKMAKKRKWTFDQLRDYFKKD